MLYVFWHKSVHKKKYAYNNVTNVHGREYMAKILKKLTVYENATRKLNGSKK